MPGKKNIFGSLTNKNTNIWSYKGTPGKEVISPVDGYCSVGMGSDSDWAIITYSNGGCNFTIKIGPLTGHNTKNVIEGQEIGKAKNNTISLMVFKNTNQINPNNLFDGEDDCFKTKEIKKEKKDKNDNNDNNPYTSRKSTQIASPDDFDFIYKNAAFPFKIFTLKTGMKEEIERIKQLMK